MAIAAAAFTNGAGSSATSFTTASKTWVNGRIYTAWVYSKKNGGGDPGTSYTVTGMTAITGMTAYAGGPDWRPRAFVWVGDGSTGTKTIDFSATTQDVCSWLFDEWTGTGMDGTGTGGFGTVTTPVGGSGANPSITIASFADAVNNAAYALLLSQNTATPEAGFTTLSSNTTNANIYSAYKVGEDTTPSWTMSAASNMVAGVEIKAPTATATDAPDAAHLPRGLERGLTRGLVNSMSQLNGLWRPEPKIWVPGGLVLA